MLQVNAAGVSIELIFRRLGYSELRATAENGALRQSCVLGDTSDAIRTTNPGPNGLAIHRNMFQGGTNTCRNNRIIGGGFVGIQVANGGGTIVDDNTITGGQGKGIATFSGNTFTSGGASTNCVLSQP